MRNKSAINFNVVKREKRMKVGAEPTIPRHHPAQNSRSMRRRLRRSRIHYSQILDPGTFQCKSPVKRRICLLGWWMNDCIRLIRNRRRLLQASKGCACEMVIWNELKSRAAEDVFFVPVRSPHNKWKFLANLFNLCSTFCQVYQLLMANRQIPSIWIEWIFQYIPVLKLSSKYFFNKQK